MNRFAENDKYHLAESRNLPQTPEEISEAQAVIEEAFTRTDKLREQLGQPPLSKEQRIERYTKLKIPAPEKYNQS